MMNRVSRRGLLGKGAAGAAAIAAAALPAANAQATELTGHTGLCFHKVYKLKVDRSAADALEERFQATLTKEQRAMYFEIDAFEGTGWCNEQVDFVEEVARHFPALAPALRAVAYHHLFEQTFDERGVCCGDI